VVRSPKAPFRSERGTEYADRKRVSVRFGASVNAGPEDAALLEHRLLDSERQRQALVSQNDRLRGLLREAISLIQRTASAAQACSFVDKVERIL